MDRFPMYHSPIINISHLWDILTFVTVGTFVTLLNLPLHITYLCTSPRRASFAIGFIIGIFFFCLIQKLFHKYLLNTFCECVRY